MFPAAYEIKTHLDTFPDLRWSPTYRRIWINAKKYNEQFIIRSNSFISEAVPSPTRKGVVTTRPSIDENGVAIIQKRKMRSWPAVGPTYAMGNFINSTIR